MRHAGHLREPRRSDRRRVPAAGIELLRSAEGGNPHTLVADEGACHWTDRVVDPTGLALGMIENTAVACPSTPNTAAPASPPAATSYAAGVSAPPHATACAAGIS
ncbi:hypothetical protein [Streptomyces sp. NBC_00063]|uniref:hypothetical protein n=1 Tax=Streptomyces sp. NBC_00063 TaxID=2975638 RepID=UPI002259399F|nr:hypothetical protein [Streptomyces sp. NBC_00063]MCX5436141.1 hypothetical protein [Streptomyces sp. NBC_00063]